MPDYGLFLPSAPLACLLTSTVLIRPLSLSADLAMSTWSAGPTPFLRQRWLRFRRFLRVAIYRTNRSDNVSAVILVSKAGFGMAQAST